MSDQDPRYQETTRTTVKETDPFRPGAPTHVESIETTVRGRENSTASWWIAGVIALAAIIAVTWMVLATAAPTEEGVTDADAVAIENAIEDARLQGQLEGAQDGLAAASAAQTSAAIAAADRAAAEAAAARAELERSRSEVVVITPPQPEPQPVPAQPQPAPMQ